MKVIIGVIVLILVFGGVYYFTQTPSSEQSDTSVKVESTMPVPSHEGVVEMVVTEESQTPEPAVGEVKAFTVEGKNFSFAPSIMTVKKGDTVRVTFKNVGGFHDFTLDEFNAQTKRINEGEEAVVEFVADKAGTFEYYCSVGNHRAMGMIGKLTVSE